jgi:nitrate/nitrite transport system substrate-binding protein
MKRRDFLKATAAALATPALLAAAPAAAQTARPAGSQIRMGFIATTDLGPVVMAERLGLYKKYGLDVLVTKEASWGIVRDKLLNGELDASMCHFGLPIAVYSGVAGTAGREIKIPMMLNTNGQGLSLHRSMVSAGYANLEAAKAAIEARRQQNTGRPPTFAMAFPGVSHDLCLRSWLAAAGVDPASVRIVTIPPAQMLANLRTGDIDGFYVGEPWHAFAARDGVGFTHYASQDLWRDHPEKCLAANQAFAANRRDELKQVTKAVLEACMWCDEPANAAEMAQILSAPAYLNVPADAIADRLAGRYDFGLGVGTKVFVEDRMRFFKGGDVNVPRAGHVVWFQAQYVRFGLTKTAPDYKAAPASLLMPDLYREVAAELKVPVPDDGMRPFALDIDRIVFDPNDPEGSLKRYS